MYMTEQLLERHIKYPSIGATEAIPSSAETPYDRSASPTLPSDDEGDDGDVLLGGTTEGVLGLILDLYKARAMKKPETAFSEEPLLPRTSTGSRGRTDDRNRSQDSERLRRKSKDMGCTSTSAAASLASIRSALAEELTGTIPRHAKGKKPYIRSKSGHIESEDDQAIGRLAEAIRFHIVRHLYLIRLCRALMTFGAPTHRLVA